MYTIYDFATDLFAGWRHSRAAVPSFRYLAPLSIITTSGYALAVLILLSFPTYELYIGYARGTGLEVGTGDFLFSGVFFLLCAVGAAWQLRRVALALNVRRLARRTTVVAEYRTDLSPAEVGVLVDVYSNRNESLAMVWRLLQRGDVRIIDINGDVYMEKMVHYVPSDEDEKVFVGYLFQGIATISPEQFVRQLDYAAANLQEHIYERMVAAGHFPARTGRQEMIHKFMSYVVGAGAVCTVLLLWMFLDPLPPVESPQYPIALWQLGFIVLLLAIVIIVPLQAFFSQVFSKPGLGKYREAAGLYDYMHTVFKDRWKAGRLASSELEYYLPYAQALGIDDSPGRHLQRFLQ